METNQRKQLSKIAGDIELVIEHSKILTTGYNLFTGKHITETDYLELSINLFRKDLFDVQFELEFDSDDFSVLDDFTMTLKNALDDKKEVYEYCMVSVEGVTRHETNRKGHLIDTLQWVISNLAHSFGIDPIELKEVV
ncbi:pathogenicity island protein [Mammaliicoccus vitulinus]|uniref:pathogenicity island protein n=1 Tax=Mammaliicoccus vitulinus TaxID=71237 RepID=UPI002DBA56D7|nr:pathogenicity island protein [Mammaliicoccus vitulinus]MEB7657617.1 pathogenicity island protein [Mammaliicoccus vitulinus]